MGGSFACGGPGELCGIHGEIVADFGELHLPIDVRVVMEEERGDLDAVDGNIVCVAMLDGHFALRGGLKGIVAEEQAGLDIEIELLRSARGRSGFQEPDGTMLLGGLFDHTDIAKQGTEAGFVEELAAATELVQLQSGDFPKAGAGFARPARFSIEDENVVTTVGDGNRGEEPVRGLHVELGRTGNVCGGNFEGAFHEARSEFLKGGLAAEGTDIMGENGVHGGGRGACGRGRAGRDGGGGSGLIPCRSGRQRERKQEQKG